MSSPASARRRAAPGPTRAAQQIHVLGFSFSLDVALGGALAVLLALLAFTTGSGVVQGSGLDLGTNTWTEIALTLIGAAALIAVLLLSARGPASGASSLLAFGALTTFTALSIAWSVAPDASWMAANQTVAYLAAFGAAMAMARLFPFRWSGLAGAIPPAAAVIGLYALLAKVFPSLPDGDGTLGRLTAPLGYWNAIGLIAAMGLPGCLWLGVREGYGRLTRTLTVPAISLLGAVVVLSYSRSALVAAVVAVGCWLLLVPRRLRAALVLLPGLAGAALLSAWFLSHHALADNNDLLAREVHGSLTAARTAAGHTFGWVVLAVLVAITLVAFALVTAGERITLGAAVRRRVATGLLVLAALVPVGGVLALASSSRGLTGEISHVWTTLTSTHSVIGSEPNRITALGNSRPIYWRDAITVGKHHLLAGAGALGYATARDRYTTYHYPVQNAHGYAFQAFADLGLIGLALNLALLCAWALATSRTLGLRLPRRAASRPDEAGRDSLDEPAGLEPTAATKRAGMDPLEADERAGLLTLLAVVVCFGIHSAIDWTWFIPTTALPALVCAGWLAGRGRLGAPVGRRPRRRGLLSHPALPLSVTAIAVVAIGLAWAIWQPLRSAQAENAALAAVGRGDGAAALSNARAAVSRDPFSLSAMSVVSQLELSAGNPAAARAEAVLETDRQPANYLSWRDLGSFDLGRHRPRAALAELLRAYHLDPFDPATLTYLSDAQQAVEHLPSATKR